MPKDYVGLRLTGELGTDVSDASGTLAFDPGARRWSDEVLDAVGVPRDALAAASATPRASLGELRRRARPRRPGSRAGRRSRAAPPTTPPARSGLGVVRAGRAMASIGTSGVVLAHTDALRRRAGDAPAHLLPRGARALLPDGRDARGRRRASLVPRRARATASGSRPSSGGVDPYEIITDAAQHARGPAPAASCSSRT